MSQARRPVNKTAAVIRSEMSAGQTGRSQRGMGFKALESVRLREYQDSNMTSLEMVSWFLQDVAWATRADISGATGLAWATVHGALEAIERDHHLARDPHRDPEEYAWKR